jgi:ATP-binding cassette subfamily C (CFTR/MRP) protein 1
MREAELKAGAIFRKLSVYAIVCSFAPMLLSPVLTFTATSQNVDTTQAYTSLAFLMLLTVPLTGLFQLLPDLVAATACFNRIASYLEARPRLEYRTFSSTESSSNFSEKTPPSADGNHLECNEQTADHRCAHSIAFLINYGYFS